MPNGHDSPSGKEGTTLGFRRPQPFIILVTPTLELCPGILFEQPKEDIRTEEKGSQQ